MRKRLRKKAGGSSGSDDKMDINLTSHIWGIGGSLTGQLTQPWYVTYTPLIAAPVSAALVFFITYYFYHKEHENAIKQQRQQANSQLSARKDIVARFYKLYADALFEASFKQAVKSMAGTSSDPMMTTDFERIIRRCDDLSLDVIFHYGNLLETLALVQEIYSNKNKKLNEKVNTIIQLNNDFIQLINNGCEKYGVIASIRIASLPYTVERGIDGLQIDPIASEMRHLAEKELKDLTIKHLLNPVSDLQEYLKSEESENKIQDIWSRLK